MLCILDSVALFPWTEVLTGLGTLLVILLGVGNSKLKKILGETKENSGSSLKDQMNRIESSILNLTLWFEATQHLSEKPMFKSDENGNFIWVNNAFSNITGKSADELKNLGWISSVVEEDREQVSKEWEDCIKDRRSFHAMFSIVNSYTDEMKHVRARAFPIFSGKSTLGYLGTWLIIEEIN